MSKYGPIKKPEEQARIEVVENALSTIMNAYDVFNRTVGIPVHAEDRPLPWYRYDEIVQRVYAHAASLLGGRSALGPDSKELVQALQEKATNGDFTGLFLSAVHNTTARDTLVVGKWNYVNMLGYQLPKQKTLILGPEAESEDAGREATGIIINWGHANDLGQHSQGIMCNLSKAHYLARNMPNGVLLNYGIADEAAQCMEAGLCINFGGDGCFGTAARCTTINMGDAYAIGWNSPGIHINKGRLKDIGISAHDGVQVNLGYSTIVGLGAHEPVINAGSTSLWARMHQWRTWPLDLCGPRARIKDALRWLVGKPGRQELREHCKTLDAHVSKLEELRNLKDCKFEQYEHVLKTLRSYDFAGFQKETERIAGDIQEALKRFRA